MAQNRMEFVQSFHQIPGCQLIALQSFPPVRACLFDLDGLLIDSEEIYSETTNIILREHGKPELPWDIKAQLQGRPGPEASRIFHEWAQLPISHAEYHEKQSALQREKFAHTKPLPGVPALLHNLVNCSTPQVQIALATSSDKVGYDIKTRHLNHIFSAFHDERKVLGDDPRIPAGRGKPAPDIFLVALGTINDGIRRDGNEPEIKPEECLVFEDSVPGIEAGRRAGMRVVWVPHPGLLEEYHGRERQVLAGLIGQHKNEEHLSREHAEAAGQNYLRAVDDWWGKLLLSLENFPYDHYGIKIRSP